jgi:hypothetical protein
MPTNKQVKTPPLEAQESVLLAATAAGPAVADTAEISFWGKEKFHCRPAGAVPVRVKMTPSEIVFPGLPVPEERPRVEVCAYRFANGQSKKTAPIASGVAVQAGSILMDIALTNVNALLIFIFFEDKY